ncbi:sodium:solute symporter [bacterium]|mgnify:FL=1|jgi:Na+/proline symporter|nr:sodium:solute symporter [bacterium]MBT4250251.1 sodium:solute symporter [bacterium]MBT4928177.1 sodium:solute symporter [bacterium]MBT6018237.1 sodium:solute symporter [bacterium]
MNSIYIVVCIILYFLFLSAISWFTGKNDTNESFFLGNKSSPWYIVAFGMIGTSLSGVTFISVPGWVESSQFSYMQMVFGYLLGYAFIGAVLMPLYYRLNLTSIYTYLSDRFGIASYKTGSVFFIISRTIGASFRLYIVARVLHLSVFQSWGVPFYLTVSITILLIWFYTFRGGIKTIIWTDTLQTFFMLLALALSVYLIGKDLGLNYASIFPFIIESDYSKIFFWEGDQHFLRRFFTGAFIAIVMTGLDQDMMQKNLSCRNIKEAQKNMMYFSLSLVIVNLLFLCLGALLYSIAGKYGISFSKPDDLFPAVVLSETLGFPLILIFILGLIAAAYSSADSALTSLTTSFCVDILEIDIKDSSSIIRRKYIHLLFSIIILVVILTLNAINDQSIISSIFSVAGYTYGPLLGLYFFGLFTSYSVNDKLVPYIAIIAPVLSYIIQTYYSIGFEILIVNALIVCLGLFVTKENKLLSAR